jgi:hypothetical protein
VVTVDPTLEPRQAAVAALMRAQPDGRLSRELVAQLAEQLGVSPATVRRDQAALAKGLRPGEVAGPAPARPKVVLLTPPPAAPPPRRGRPGPAAQPSAPSAPSPPPADTDPGADELDPDTLVTLPLQDALARLAGRALLWANSPRGDWALKSLQLGASLLTQRHQLIELNKAGDEDLDEAEVERRVLEALSTLPPRVRRLVGLG